MNEVDIKKSTDSAGEQLYKILRERILLGDLLPGEKLSEAEIARFYQTSRQPVREAFIKLSMDNLIQIRPRSGSVIRKIDTTSILEIRFIREAIEADIVKELVVKASPSVINDLKLHIDDQKHALTHDLKAFNNLDRAFHRALADGAGKGDVWQIMRPIETQLDRIRFLTVEVEYISESLKRHEMIVNAIEARDIEMANAAIRIHIREIEQRLHTIKEKYPDYFE